MPGATGDHDLRLDRGGLAGGVLRHVVQAAAALTGARYAAVGVLAAAGRLLESFTTYGVDEELRARIGDPPRGMASSAW